VGLRNWLKKLERDSSSDLESFALLDGSTFYFDGTDAELYLHAWRCLEAGHPDNWPEPPEVLFKVLQARDVGVALEQVGSQATWDIFPYERAAIINERRLEPRSIVEGHDLGDEALDLSE
jgi:hypothetical protein